MIIDLREVIGVPGTSVSFDYEPDLSVLVADSVTGTEENPRAEGYVKNSAGLLTLVAHLDARLICSCSRCLTEFSKDISCTVEARLSEDETAEEDPEYYYLEGASLDPDEVISTELLMGLESVHLCSEDCRGLCQRCGKNLNEGDCGCKPEIDPRLMELSKLLDDSRDAD